MTQLAARTGVSDTYPAPSNATAKAALAAMWDVINEMSQAAEIDLASAATTNIGGQASRKLRITGTTGITSFGTTYTGPIPLRFAGALTITHHATTLICPGGVNLTVAAGDMLIATPKCTTSGTFDGWMILGLQRATGKADTAVLADTAITATNQSGGTVNATKTSGSTTTSTIVGTMNSASGGTAIYGVSNNAAGSGNKGVHGVSASSAGGGAGVSGERTGGSGQGVMGTAEYGYGVYGSCNGANNSDVGVYGGSINGYGVVAASDTTSPLTAAFRITPQDAQPTTGQVGDLYITTAGVLKVCTGAGTPGTWASVGAQT